MDPIPSKCKNRPDSTRWRPTLAAFWLSGIVVGLGPAGCERTPRPPSDRPGGLIVLVGASQDGPLWPVWQAAAHRFNRTSRRYQIQAAAPARASVKLQNELIAALPRGRLRGLCVQVSDPAASRAALESLRSDGLVVVTLLKRLESPERFLHSGVNEYDIGTALADALAGQIEAPGTLATLLAENQLCPRLRARGFHARMGRYPRLTLLRELDCGPNPAAAAEMMRRTMERFEGLDAWAIMDNWPLRSGPDAPLLLPITCRLVAPGPLAGVTELIRRGQVDAVVLADYADMVDKALEICAIALDGDLPLFPDYNASLITVTHDTLHEFDKRWADWTRIPESVPQK